MTTEQEHSLLTVAVRVLSELDVDGVIDRLLESARELTKARYAALGVLDTSRTELERFITVGISDEDRRGLGPLPRGRGVLGELIRHPVSLRLANVGQHPGSYGFPLGHPPMRSFLGVPILVGGLHFGSLYLTEKHGGGAFTDADEKSVTSLAEIAGVAIDHAQRSFGAAVRSEELARTVAALEATTELAHAVTGATDLDQILELVAKRGRALVSAKALFVELVDGDELVIAAGAGQLPASVVGERFSLADTVASAALRTRTTLRLEVDLNRARFDQHGLGRLGVSARAGLVVPLVFHNQSYGVLIVLDGLEGEPGFTTEDERLLEAFAASAATAQAAASKLHRERVIAAENERGRWARALHDETLQALAGARLGLATARRRRDAKTLDEAVIQVIGDLDDGIANLRSLVADLRPVALDELGLEAAVEALCARACRDGLEIDRSIELASTPGGEPTRHTSELETALYRIIQEALTNATKHGQAKRAVVEISETRTTVELSVRDDGTGFDPLTSTAGFGLLGMRERVALLRGSARIESAPGDGTRVTARFPVYRRAARTLAGPPDEPLRAGTA